MIEPAPTPPAADDPRRERAIQLATQALHAAFRDDQDAATEAVQTLGDELGGPGLAVAVKTWIDTLITASRRAGVLPGSVREDGMVRPAWRDISTGRTATDADQVPPEFRWAGRLVAARVAMDRPAYDALIAALPADGAAVGRHVSALLGMVVLTLRAAGWGVRVRLGRVQRLALRQLAQTPGGLTVNGLEDALADPAITVKTLYTALASLGDKGLVRVAGTEANGDPAGQGARRKVWAPTRLGRDVLAEGRTRMLWASRGGVRRRSAGASRSIGRRDWPALPRSSPAGRCGGTQGSGRSATGAALRTPSAAR